MKNPPYFTGAGSAGSLDESFGDVESLLPPYACRHS